MLSHFILLEKFGPQLGRPKADSLVGSKYANKKELRFEHNSDIWRVAYAFDIEREGIVLCAGNKRGKNQKRIYKTLITTADRRFSNHLALLKTRKMKPEK